METVINEKEFCESMDTAAVAPAATVVVIIAGSKSLQRNKVNTLNAGKSVGKIKWKRKRINLIILLVCVSTRASASARVRTRHTACCDTKDIYTDSFGVDVTATMLQFIRTCFRNFAPSTSQSVSQPTIHFHTHTHTQTHITISRARLILATTSYAQMPMFNYLSPKRYISIRRANVMKSYAPEVFGFMRLILFYDYIYFIPHTESADNWQYILVHMVQLHNPNSCTNICVRVWLC